MIIRMEQVGVRGTISFGFTANGAPYCTAEAPYIPGKVDMSIRYWDGWEQRLVFEPGVKGSLRERLSYWLYESGMQVGQFVGSMKKLGFLNGYPLYEVQYKGEAYQLYEATNGTQIFMCLYQDERLLAVGKKDPVVIDYKDTYTLYLENESHAAVFIAAMLYYDCVAHVDGHDSNYQQHSRATTVKRACHPELAAKYDPEFIPRIVAMEGRAAE